MKRFKYWLATCLYVVLLMSCSTENSEVQWGTPWDGNGKPTWLSAKVEKIFLYEFYDGFNSFSPRFISATLEKFIHQNEPYISIQYISHNGKNIHKRHILYNNQGVETTDKEVKKSYDRKRELIGTSQIGGKNGYIPQVEGVNEAWLQKEINQICSRVDEIKETILSLYVFSFDSINYGSCFAIHKKVLTANEQIMEYRNYYSNTGDIFNEGDSIFDEINQEQNQLNKKCLLNTHADIFQCLH